VLYIQKPEILKQAFSVVPEYLKTSEDAVVENYMDYGIQLGRRFRSLKFWFIMRYFGADGLSDRLRNHIRLGQLFAKWIDADHVFERLAPAPFSTVCFRAKPEGWNDEKKIDELNEKLMNEINATGKVFLSHTKLNDKFTIRLVVSGIRMEEKHVALAWEVIQESLKRILNKTNQIK
jgi:aromatic-L-amino-acid decarboxylase